MRGEHLLNLHNVGAAPELFLDGIWVAGNINLQFSVGIKLAGRFNGKLADRFVRN